MLDELNKRQMLERAAQIKEENNKPDEDMSDMLQELRILLQGAQVLTAFLIILPFNQGFSQIDQFEKWIYLATFLCSISTLVLFSAPAAMHRLARPLIDRVGFKTFATRMIIIGLVPLSLALTLVTHLVVTQVFGFLEGTVTAIIVGALILGIWWVIPLVRKKHL